MYVFLLYSLHDSANGHAQYWSPATPSTDSLAYPDLFLVVVTHVQSYHNYIIGIQYS